MIRQDRTNPSTAVSNWKGRKDTARGWPSTGVSTWLNGGLFGSPLVATGGIITQYTDSGKTYRVHAFRGDGKFVVASGSADVDWLLVGGGGGTGVGGGGAGGVLGSLAGASGATTASGAYSVSAGSYTIVVGTGGAAGNSSGSGNADGNDSTAFGYTADGGGQGR